MKTVFMVLVCLVLLPGATAQIITILDRDTGEPLELATLRDESGRAFVVSDQEGKADLSVLEGSSRIQVRMLGYKTVTKSHTELTANPVLRLAAALQLVDGVVVSATRWKQTSRNVPSRISAISPEDVALLNPQTAADLLGTSGEVFIQKSQQGGGSPMIRGFSSNRLLYTVDGVRMNTAIFRSGNIQNVISLDPFAIESTEVLFGPGSVIYGSDAIGGVMSFQTLTPHFSDTEKLRFSGQAVSRVSSANNELTSHFNVQVGGQKWASVTSISHARYGNLRMGTHGPDEYLKRFVVMRIDSVDRVVENPDPHIQDPTAYAQINLMQKLRYRPHADWDLQYGFHYSETTPFGRYDRLIERRPDGLPRSAVWNYGPQIWMMNNLTVTHDRANRFYNRMALRVAQQTFEESRIDRNFSGEQRFRLRTQEEQVQAWSANLDLEKISGKHVWYYGAEYVFNDVRSAASALDIRNGDLIPVPDRYPQSTWQSLGAYINYQYLLSDAFLLQAGARYNYFRIESDFTRHLSFYPFDFTATTIDNAAATGQLGLVYRPDETWKLSVNASSGFRAPNVDDMGKIFDFVGGQVIVPNTRLAAEYTWNGEIGVAKVIREVVRLDVTSYYTYLDNAMVRRPFRVGGQDSIVFNGELSEVYAIQNAAYGTVYGFNAGIEIKLPGGFSMTSQYNYQVGREETEDGEITPTRHAAPAFGLTRINYKRDGLLLQLYAMYSAEVNYADLNLEERQKPAIYAKDADGNLYSPGWYTLNFKAMYQLSDQWSVSAGVENLTDQRYRPYSSGLVAPGRNYVLSLRAGF
jgi:hemoglobin/transferrin/lactoferrin receptor protein